MATVISMKALLESGVHFGHRTNKWNPRMRPYIFTERNGIHIIDLQQTVKSLSTAYNVIRDTVAQGGSVLFVGTKRQAQETVKEEAVRCGMPFVTERWMGGILTNWVTMFQRIMEMERMEKMRDTGEINRLTKKEGLLIQREIDRLLVRLSGIRQMRKLPELVFIVDVTREDTAIREANKLNIPVIALVDTNCDPSGVDYVIPSNDDAIRAIKLLVGKVADAVLEGMAYRKDSGFEMVEAAPVNVTLPEESSLDEKDLLGEATLAKLSGSRQTVEVAEVAKAVEVTEVAEAPKAVEVVEVAKPAKAAKAAVVTEVAEAAEAAEVVEVVKPAKPAKAAKVVEAVEATEAAEVVEVVKPAKTAKAAKVTEAPEAAETAPEVVEEDGEVKE